MALYYLLSKKNRVYSFTLILIFAPLLNALLFSVVESFNMPFLVFSFFTIIITPVWGCLAGIGVAVISFFYVEIIYGFEFIWVLYLFYSIITVLIISFFSKLKSFSILHNIPLFLLILSLVNAFLAGLSLFLPFELPGNFQLFVESLELWGLPHFWTIFTVYFLSFFIEISIAFIIGYVVFRYVQVRYDRRISNF